MRKLSRLALVSAATFSLLLSQNLRADEIITDEITSEMREQEIKEAVNHISQGAVLIESGVAEIVSTVLGFFWNRVPNAEELFYDISLGAFIEIALKKVGLDFGNNNPSAKSIIRDISKVPSAVLKAFYNVEVGGTGIKFGTANVVSQITKPLTKIGCIVLLKKHGYEDDSASEICNYPGDFFARIFVLAGKDKQKSENSDYFYQYFVEKFNKGWIVRPLIQETVKNFVVNLISGVYASYQVGDTVSNGVYRMAGHNFLVTYIATAAVQYVSTMCLGTPARIVSDVVDWASSPFFKSST